MRQHEPHCQIPYLYLDENTFDHILWHVLKEKATDDQTLTDSVLSQAYMVLRLPNGKQPADFRGISLG